LNADLAPKQLLMRGQFTTGISATPGAGVPDGKLAVTVEVTMAPGVAEKVAGGDRVTVFVTYPKGQPAADQKTRILLPAATVISITVGTPTPSDVTPSPAPTKTRNSTSEQQQSYPATLAVSAADAVRLVHAAQTGLIYLALVGAKASVSPAPAVNYSSLWQ
jgi:pilus assembly protein CpaB